jgi:hypothetical protein
LHLQAIKCGNNFNPLLYFEEVFYEDMLFITYKCHMIQLSSDNSASVVIRIEAELRMKWDLICSWNRDFFSSLHDPYLPAVVKDSSVPRNTAARS